MSRRKLLGTLASAAVFVALAFASDAMAATTVSTAPHGNFWLVKTNPTATGRPSDQYPLGDATVEDLPSGQHPAGRAVFLGNNVSDIGPHLSEAAHRLGLNPATSNVQNSFAKAGIGDLLATFGIVTGGLAVPVVVAGATGGAAATGGTAAGVAGAAKGTIGKLLPSGSSEPAGSAAGAFAVPALAAAAAALAGTAAHLLSRSQAIDLRAGWFTSLQGRVLAAFAGLMLLALLITLGTAAVRGDGSLALGGFTGVGEAVALTFMVGTLTAAALVATDQLSTSIAGPGLNDAQHMLDAFGALLLTLAGVATAAGALGHVGLAHVAGTGAWGLSFVALVALGLLVLDLSLRSIAIYAILLILPMAAAARAYPSLKVWSTRLLKVLFALVTMKLLLTLLIAMGAGMSLHGGVGGAWLGTLTLLVVGLSPIALYRLVGFAEHGAFHGRHVGMAAAGTAAYPVMRTIQNRREEIAAQPEGSPAEAAAGWYEGRGGSFGGAGSSGGGDAPRPPRPSRPSGPSFASDLASAREHGGRTRRDPYVPQERYGRVQEFDRDLEQARQRTAAEKEDA